MIYAYTYPPLNNHSGAGQRYETAQLRSLKAGLLGAALLALLSLGFTKELPHSRPARPKSTATPEPH